MFQKSFHLTVLLGVVFVIVFLFEGVLSNVYAQNPTLVKVSVHITRIESHGQTDDNSQADLYSEVFYDKKRIGKRVALSNQDFVNVDWLFEGPTQNSSRIAPIRITVRDGDPNSADEWIDISRVNQRPELLLKVYPFTTDRRQCGLVVDELFSIGRSPRNYHFTGNWVRRGNSEFCNILNLRSLGAGDKHPGFIQYSIFVVRL